MFALTKNIPEFVSVLLKSVWDLILFTELKDKFMQMQIKNLHVPYIYSYSCMYFIWACLYTIIFLNYLII